MDTMRQVGINLADEIRFGLLEPAALALLWNGLETHFMLYGRGLLEIATIAELKEALFMNKLGVWVSGNFNHIKLVALTQTTMFARKPQLVVVWIGGIEFKKYAPPLLEAAEKWCAIHGIKEITFNGRKGWTRRLQREGFVVPRFEYVKKVSYTLDENKDLVRSH